MEIINGKHVSKIIFEEIGKILNVSGFHCYTQYLTKIFDVSLNLKVFSKSISISKDHVSYYYKKDNEKCKFFFL